MYLKTYSWPLSYSRALRLAHSDRPAVEVDQVKRSQRDAGEHTL